MFPECWGSQSDKSKSTIMAMPPRSRFLRQLLYEVNCHVPYLLYNDRRVSVFPPVLSCHPSIRVTEAPVKSPRYLCLHFVSALTARALDLRILPPVPKSGRAEVRKTTRRAFGGTRARQAPAAVRSTIRSSVKRFYNPFAVHPVASRS